MDKIITNNGHELYIDKRQLEGRAEIEFQIKGGEECVLHWGFCSNQDSTWHMPPKAFWSIDSQPHGDTAVQTRFTPVAGKRKAVITINNDAPFPKMVFALFYPGKNIWDNNNGRNYYVEIQRPAINEPNLDNILKEATKGKEVSFEHRFNLDGGMQLAVAVAKCNNVYNAVLVSNISSPLILHWGVAMRTQYEWALPHSSILPAGSEILAGAAAQTLFTNRDGVSRLELVFSGDNKPLRVQFILKLVESGLWLKDAGKNFSIPIAAPLNKNGHLDSAELSALADEIIDFEMGGNSVTLMHRFNLCHDLLDRFCGCREGLTMIYVWMRFSAIRQLDWQRNYNTQPKELSHAQDRLTLKIADLYINSQPEGRELLRLIIAALGRGGDGQRIRDDILHIMHRHHIKEVSGHFMEEWHQKLHNNTTPDDVVICRGYLEFLKSNGDLGLFYKILNDEGVTKERLASFERPIVTPPDFVPHIKDGLIYDFENYLKLLKSVHSGADLETSINAARDLLDGGTVDLLNNIHSFHDCNKEAAMNLASMVVDARKRVAAKLDSCGERGQARSFIYLDLALEEFFRVIIERNLHLGFEGGQLVELIGFGLENARFAQNDDEFADCFAHWGVVKDMPLFEHDWALRARSILDRVERLSSAFIDNYYQLLQPKAEFLGGAFNAEAWTISLFSEEIVRGMPAFVISQLMRQMDPVLRKAANLGNWQIISRAEPYGRLEIVDNLEAVQEKRYDLPTVIVAGKVNGNEEAPENVKAVITSDTIDIVSHVAVRARNAGVLFATCYDHEIIKSLKSLNGSFIDLTIDMSGNVEFEKRDEKPDKETFAKAKTINRKFTSIESLGFAGYAIAEKDFKAGLVGCKSINIASLRRALPDWINAPNSVAIPFGSFEKILNSDKNKTVAKQYKGLADNIADNENTAKGLAELRKSILELEVDNELLTCLRGIMKDAMIEFPEDSGPAWECIKQVWASKWNDRAYLSRNNNGLPHGELFMAVLIQHVVNADYAFVIHTANPFSGDKNELYAEVVPGLGETLVGNYPGRALGFTAVKSALEPKLLSFSGKSVGLFGDGLIFRSDSNGEDLEGYAGAGLYDSVMLREPREIKLKYTKDPLIQDESFRNELLTNISKIGVEVENICQDVPQDIEGVFSKGRYYVVQTRCQVGT